ncbi:MAG: hypothetical protein HY674_06765 [Chloroflexi bacterium]|nr:hypothetical protein [Chloroflexota bacterium]
MNPPMLAGGGVELFDIVLILHGLGPFAEELRNCVDVALGRDKLKVLRVDRILASKRAANRAKDRLVIPVLEDSLAASQLSAWPGTRKASSPRKRKSSP